jgi:putative membrane protein insertion efficiency factor
VVFDGPWRRRRQQPPYDPNQPGYGPYDQQGYPPQYDPRYQRGFGGYGPRGGSSCLRDLLFLDAGCCIAEGLGCGPNLLLVAPSVARRTAPAPWRSGVRRWLRQWLLAMIAVYQSDISPRRRPCCRYSPTCSHYAAEALERHGLARGSWLAARRLLRCRPGSTGGYDPVPTAD